MSPSRFWRSYTDDDLAVVARFLVDLHAAVWRAWDAEPPPPLQRRPSLTFAPRWGGGDTRIVAAFLDDLACQVLDRLGLTPGGRP